MAGAVMGRWLSMLISDGDGQPSTMRVYMLVLGVVVVGNWLYWQFREGRYIPFPLGDSVLLGALSIGKAVQSYAEAEPWRKHEQP